MSIDTGEVNIQPVHVRYATDAKRLGMTNRSIVSMKCDLDESVEDARIPPPECFVMKSFTLGLLGAAALATTILLVRQTSKDATQSEPRVIPAGETQAGAISLERIRELGL